MIYETAVVLKVESSKESQAKLKDVIGQLVSKNGEILVSDDWGVKTFAQATEKGIDKGLFLYFLFQSDGKENNEINRRLKIDENVLRYMTIKKGLDRDKDKIVKAYQAPFKK